MEETFGIQKKDIEQKISGVGEKVNSIIKENDKSKQNNKEQTIQTNKNTSLVTKHPGVFDIKAIPDL